MTTDFGLRYRRLAVGEPTEDMYRILEYITPKLPETSLEYLMGVGEPLDMLEAVEHRIRYDGLCTRQG